MYMDVYSCILVLYTMYIIWIDIGYIYIYIYTMIEPLTMDLYNLSIYIYV